MSEGEMVFYIHICTGLLKEQNQNLCVYRNVKCIRNCIDINFKEMCPGWLIWKGHSQSEPQAMHASNLIVEFWNAAYFYANARETIRDIPRVWLKKKACTLPK